MLLLLLLPPPPLPLLLLQLLLLGALAAEGLRGATGCADAGRCCYRLDF